MQTFLSLSLPYSTTSGHSLSSYPFKCLQFRSLHGTSRHLKVPSVKDHCHTHQLERTWPFLQTQCFKCSTILLTLDLTFVILIHNTVAHTWRRGIWGNVYISKSNCCFVSSRARLRSWMLPCSKPSSQR